MQSQISSNLEILTKEKSLIAAGHKELATMTDDIRQQLGKSLTQLTSFKNCPSNLINGFIFFPMISSFAPMLLMTDGFINSCFNGSVPFLIFCNKDHGLVFPLYCVFYVA